MTILAVIILFLVITKRIDDINDFFFNLLHLCIALVIQGGSVLFNNAFLAY